MAAAACVGAEGGPTAGHAKKERLGGDKEAEAGCPLRFPRWLVQEEKVPREKWGSIPATALLGSNPSGDLDIHQMLLLCSM